MRLATHRYSWGNAIVRNAWFAVCVAAFVAVFLPGSAGAQDQSLKLELNRVEQQGEACRLDWRLTNESAANIRDLTIEFVLFDKGGVNIGRFSVPFGALLAHKSTLRSFGLRPLDCSPIGEVLVNEVTSCEADNGLNCLAAIAVSSRSEVRLTR